MVGLGVRSPALWTDCLACAGGRALARKAAIWMKSKGDSVAIFADGSLVAVVYLVPDEEGRREFCLSIAPGSRDRMRQLMTALCRLAHSTLTRLSDNGVVVISHINPANLAGHRMARLCGFRPVGGTLWIFEGEAHGRHSQEPVRRRQQREEGSGAEPGTAARGE